MQLLLSLLPKHTPPMCSMGCVESSLVSTTQCLSCSLIFMNHSSWLVMWFEAPESTGHTAPVLELLEIMLLAQCGMTNMGHSLSTFLGLFASYFPCCQEDDIVFVLPKSFFFFWESNSQCRAFRIWCSTCWLCLEEKGWFGPPLQPGCSLNFVGDFDGQPVHFPDHSSPCTP